MLGFSALVAGSFALGSLMANDIPPSVFTALRFLLASFLMAGLALMTTGLPRSTFAAPWRYLLLGGIYVVYFVAMFEGLKTAPAVSAAAVFTLTPVMSGIFGWLVLRQIATKRMVLALAIGGLGALWVIFRADWEVLRAFEIGQGELIYFLGCIPHALYPVLVVRLSRDKPSAAFSFAVVASGAVMLTILAWPSVRTVDWAALRPIVWVTLGYVSVFATAGSFVLLRIGALRLPSATVMAYTYLTPSWVILWEIALGKGAPSGIVLIGIGLTVVALLMLLRDEGQRPAFSKSRS